MCIFTVKGIIKYYTEQNTPVYTGFLDASKAVDRINHWTLIHKLVNCKIPLIIVRLLIFWYQTQLVCIKWGKSTSDYISISNGVRQGGILSPKLFALNNNSLTNKLIDCKAGCYIDMQCINHVLYVRTCTNADFRSKVLSKFTLSLLVNNELYVSLWARPISLIYDVQHSKIYHVNCFFNPFLMKHSSFLFDS